MSKDDHEAQLRAELGRFEGWDEKKIQAYRDFCRGTGLTLDTRDEHPPLELDVLFAMIRRRSRFEHYWDEDQRRRADRASIPSHWPPEAP